MYVYPAQAENSTCALLFVPVELVPIVGALFGRMERRAEWATAEDWQQGYKAFVALQEQLMNNCVDDLVQEIRDLRGLKPEFADTDPTDRASSMYRSLNDLVQAIRDAQGILSDGWFTDPVYATLADIVKAMRGGDATKGSNLWDQIKDLISTGSNVASIASFVTGLLTSQEETVVEGGLLMALNALTAANAAMLQQIALTVALQGGKIDSIIETLRGDIEPDDNILVALRGTQEASATRNVVDLLE